MLCGHCRRPRMVTPDGTRDQAADRSNDSEQVSERTPHDFDFLVGFFVECVICGRCMAE